MSDDAMFEREAKRRGIDCDQIANARMATPDAVVETLWLMAAWDIPIPEHDRFTP